jgi:hypothetical protein
MRNSEASRESGGKQRRKIRWEYQIQEINLSRAGSDNTPQILDMLNSLGAENWEALHIWTADDKSHGFVLLKRPV